MQVLGDTLAGDGERVAVQQAGAEQGLHHDRNAANGVDVGHDVTAERLHVGQVRNRVADAIEVVQAELNVRLVRDREQVQYRVGGAAECHDHSDRVLEGLFGHDRARGDPRVDEVHGSLAGALGVVVAA